MRGNKKNMTICWRSEAIENMYCPRHKVLGVAEWQKQETMATDLNFNGYFIYLHSSAFFAFLLIPFIRKKKTPSYFGASDPFQIH